MSQIGQLITLVNNLSERLNQIEANSKRIFELPANTVQNGLSKFAISRPNGLSETTEYITLNAILEFCIEEIQNIQDSTKLIQMLPPELLSSPRRIFIPTSNDDGDVPIIWKINGIQYGQEDDQEIEIPDADEDNYRKDLILGDENGQVILFSGIESEGGIVEPIQPENTVLLTSIVVFGDSVYEEPALPINGSLYVSKQSEQWVNFILTGNPATMLLINENNRNINITGNPTGLSSLGGYFAYAGASSSNFWDGMTARVLNSSPNNQTIKHNYSGAAIKYLFPNEDDYTIRPNEVVYFDLKGGNLVFRYNTISSTLEKDIFSDVTVGAITAGDTLGEGTTFTEFVEQLLTKTFYPTFTPYSISGSAGSAVEVGTGTKTITVNFTRGNIEGDLDSGVWNPTLVQGQVLGEANKYWINGIDNGASNSASVSKITTLGTNSVNIAVDYDAGDQPKDSKGDDYLTPEPAGTLNGVATWQGFYYRTAIAGNSVPTASDIRTSYTARRSNAGVINMPTGTTNVRFDVFVPQGSSLTSAIDEGNLNLNITAEFILQGSNFSGLDANGDEVLYKHYVRIVDNPYTVSSNIAITVT